MSMSLDASKLGCLDWLLDAWMHCTSHDERDDERAMLRSSAGLLRTLPPPVFPLNMSELMLKRAIWPTTQWAAAPLPYIQQSSLSLAAKNHLLKNRYWMLECMNVGSIQIINYSISLDSNSQLYFTNEGHHNSQHEMQVLYGKRQCIDILIRVFDEKIWDDHKNCV